MANPYIHLRVERADHVLVATLDRAETLNALNDALRADLAALAEDVRTDERVRVLVLTGAGRGFCSGADMASGLVGGATQNDLIDELESAGRRALDLYSIDKPIIGAINGICVGAGMSLALSCDIRIGSPAARFRTMFTERSLSPDSGMSYFLPRIVGYSRAADLLLTSREVGAEEALRLGLLDRLLTPDEDLLSAAMDVAATIAARPPVAVRSTKRVLQHNADAAFIDALRNENAGVNFARRAVEDCREAIASFREKRMPIYHGR